MAFTNMLVFLSMAMSTFAAAALFTNYCIVEEHSENIFECHMIVKDNTQHFNLCGGLKITEQQLIIKDWNLSLHIDWRPL